MISACSAQLVMTERPSASISTPSDWFAPKPIVRGVLSPGPPAEDM